MSDFLRFYFGLEIWDWNCYEVFRAGERSYCLFSLNFKLSSFSSEIFYLFIRWTCKIDSMICYTTSKFFFIIFWWWALHWAGDFLFRSAVDIFEKNLWGFLSFEVPPEVCTNFKRNSAYFLFKYGLHVCFFFDDLFWIYELDSSLCLRKRESWFMNSSNALKIILIY